MSDKELFAVLVNSDNLRGFMPEFLDFKPMIEHIKATNGWHTLAAAIQGNGGGDDGPLRIEINTPRGQPEAGLAAGGSFSAGRPMIVGELGPELIFPSAGGHVMNAQRTAQILASGINRGMPAGGGGPALINAPVTSVNNNQSNTTVTSTSLKHPSPLLATVNAAA